MSSKSSADRSRNGAACRARPSSSPSAQGSAADSATICWARMSSGRSGTTMASSRPWRVPRSSAAHSTSSSRVVGYSRPDGVPVRVWLERPTRCRKVAKLRGEPIWHTSSTGPTSMPSSSEAVATRARRSPARSRASMLGMVRTVLFAPEDLALVRGDPTERRGSSTSCWSSAPPGWPGCGPTTTGSSSSATRCSRPPGWPAGGATETLDVWDGHLTDSGAAAARRPARADRGLAAAHVALGVRRGRRPGRPRRGARLRRTVPLGRGGLRAVHGRGRCPTPRSWRRRWPSGWPNGADQLDRGVTLVGPHRDDLVSTSAPAPAKGFASHGESWSLALALKLRDVRAP